MLFSRKNGTLDSIHGFWCRPMTTQGWFRHSKSKCLWAKSWCRYSQSSNAKFVKTSFDCEMKTCLLDTTHKLKPKHQYCETNMRFGLYTNQKQWFGTNTKVKTWEISHSLAEHRWEWSQRNCSQHKKNPLKKKQKNSKKRSSRSC